MKACIACAEVIQDSAKLCKHCNTRQDDPSFAAEKAPSKNSDDPKLKIIKGAATLIRGEETSDGSQLSSFVCEEIFETVEATNRLMGELSEGSFPEYRVAERESNPGYLKLLGEERSNQNLALASKAVWGRQYFCDGKGWLVQEVGEPVYLKAFDRRTRMLCLPHDKPALASALILVNEYQAFEGRLNYELGCLQDQEYSAQEDALFVREALRWLKLAYLSIQSVPVIGAAIEHHASQLDYRNANWRGRQRPYRPFPWV